MQQIGPSPFPVLLGRRIQPDGIGWDCLFAAVAQEISTNSFTAALNTLILESVNIAEANVEIKNRLGLHLRAASALAQTAARFSCQVSIGRGKNLINAKSVTGLMMLGAGQGSKLKVRTEGADAREALKAVQNLFENRFGEE